MKRWLGSLTVVMVVLGITAVGAGTAAADSSSPSTIYYSPYNEKDTRFLLANAPGARTKFKLEWAPGNCATAPSHDNVPASVTMLAGWSIGRLGPAYFLGRASAQERERIDQVLMIDPGPYSELSTSCDATKVETGLLTFKTPGQILAEWLLANRQAHFYVLAGDLTADVKHPIDKHAHAGIQNVYFNDIRALQASSGVDLVSRVTVCDYEVSPPPNTTTHEQMYLGSQQYIDDKLTGCPTIDKARFTNSWSP